MAKLVKMLNIQNLIILIVLLGTTLVNSALDSMEEPEIFPNVPRRVVEAKIRMFKAHLEHFKSMTGGTVNGANHFNSWSDWNDTPYVFRENCLMNYEDALLRAGMDQDSDGDESGRLAYKALDKEINEAVNYSLGLLTHHPALKEGLRSILKKGEFLKFAAYWAKANKTTMEQLIGQHMRNDPNLNLEQAELIAILPGYLTRVA